MKLGITTSIALFTVAMLLILIQIICRFTRVSIGARLLIALYSLAFTVVSVCVLIFTISFCAKTQPYKNNFTRVTVKYLEIDEKVTTKTQQVVKYNLYPQGNTPFKVCGDNSTKRIKDGQSYVIINNRLYINPYPKYLPNKIWTYFSRDTIPYLQEIHY